MQQQKLKFKFAELNIRHRGDPERTLAVVRRAVRMGYDAVAINVDIGKFGTESGILQSDEEDDAMPRKKKRKKQKQQKRTNNGTDGKASEDEIVPDPFLVDESKLDLSTFAVNGRRFRQFTRLTVTIDADSIHRLQHNKKVKLYDIVAVRVPDEQILMTLQRKGDFVDLISLDATTMEKGLTFELCYAHALAGSEHRRQFFTNARRLMEITRAGRVGVVLSSGAEEMLQLRGPFDAANLCSLFGLTPKCGRRFVTSNALSVLLRSQTRRHTIKGVIHVADLDLPSQVASNSGKFLAEMPSIIGGQNRKGPTTAEGQQFAQKFEGSPKRKKMRVDKMDNEIGRPEPSTTPMEFDNLFEIFT
uniref:Ribonuclease P protein subunit p30 n=1 Tax=Globodera rostochiensis TaxID=31243 RepID=A0A914HW54_GLORO